MNLSSIPDENERKKYRIRWYPERPKEPVLPENLADLPDDERRDIILSYLQQMEQLAETDRQRNLEKKRAIYTQGRIERHKLKAALGKHEYRHLQRRGELSGLGLLFDADTILRHRRSPLKDENR